MEDIVSRFKDAKILVIGDMMIDEFIWGKVERISPEAPVPVINIVKETFTLGGGTNVINNINSLGGTVYPTGIIGDDKMGEKLIVELTKQHIDTEGIIIDGERPTTVKTRIIGQSQHQSQHIVRVDRESNKIIDEWIIRRMLSYIKSVLPQINGIVISDYGKGVISTWLLEEIIPLAKKQNLVITVDPKVNHFLNYKYVTVITPNQYEAGQLVNKPITDEFSLQMVGEEILTVLGSNAVLITRGEKGMSLFEQGKRTVHIPTIAQEVYDVTGAGDTVISVLTMCLAIGVSMEEASRISNYAAGIVVEKVGTAVVTPDELIARIKR